MTRKNEVRTADASSSDALQTAHVPLHVRRAAQAEWEESAPAVDDHATVVPTEADYEKARTVGIGNEPELPPGKVETGSTVRSAN